MSEKAPIEILDESGIDLKIRVLVLGPFPGTSGGIGTMMKHLQETISKRSDLVFLDPGSTGNARLRSFLRALNCILTRHKSFDVAHINLSSNGSFFRKLLLGWALDRAGRPYVVHLHGSEFREFYSALPRIVQHFCRSFMANAKKVLVLGREWQKFLVQDLSCPPENVVTLPNAVPGPRERPVRTGREGGMLFTGRVGRRKGIPELLEAVSTLPMDPRWSLTLAGDVVDKEIQVLLRGAPESVSSLGWLSQEDLRDVLRQNSIFVLPSHAEGLPLSLLDAMAWGLAPIVSNVGSIGEAVSDGVDAVVIEPGDVTSLRSAIAGLLSDPVRVESLGTAARSTWEARYSMVTYRKQLDDVYETCSKG